MRDTISPPGSGKETVIVPAELGKKKAFQAETATCARRKNPNKTLDTSYSFAIIDNRSAQYTSQPELCPIFFCIFILIFNSVLTFPLVKRYNILTLTGQ